MTDGRAQRARRGDHCVLHYGDAMSPLVHLLTADEGHKDSPGYTACGLGVKYVPHSVRGRVTPDERVHRPVDCMRCLLEVPW